MIIMAIVTGVLTFFVWVALSPVRTLVYVFAAFLAAGETVEALRQPKVLTPEAIHLRHYTNRRFAQDHGIEHWDGRATHQDRQRYLRDHGLEEPKTSLRQLWREAGEQIDREAAERKAAKQ